MKIFLIRSILGIFFGAFLSVVIGWFLFTVPRILLMIALFLFFSAFYPYFKSQACRVNKELNNV
ncbi:MAG: hypothetical protein ACQEV0_01005 [Bacillota bacterium]